MLKKSFLIESTPADKKAEIMRGSSNRGSFDASEMRKAIEQGAEVGFLYQSNNDRYKMPVAKYRIIQPVAMGTDRNGSVVIRAIHVFGQSEKVAQQSGVRSAEAENEWRLFKADNIKGMWLTGRYYSDPIPNVSSSDKGMSSVSVVYDAGRAKAAQDALLAQQQQEPQPEEEPIQEKKKLQPKDRKKWVRSLFAKKNL